MTGSEAKLEGKISQEKSPEAERPTAHFFQTFKEETPPPLLFVPDVTENRGLCQMPIGKTRTTDFIKITD